MWMICRSEFEWLESSWVDLMHSALVLLAR